MKISTRGRYAIRVMLDLSEHRGQGYIPLTEIAKRQEISEKYLEAIVGTLSKNKFVNSLRGKGGGYQLAKEPEHYTIASILKVTEGSLAPVTCLEAPVNQCKRVNICKTVGMWEELYQLIENYFEGITLKDLMPDDTE